MTHPLRAVLIDDESSAISNLRKLVETYCEGVEIVGNAMSAVDGIKVIEKTKPDLVFLDIEMPGGNGFDMLECFKQREFDVIFVTSYNQHAIKAFQYSVVDYLLKPVDIDLLIQAVYRVRKRKTEEMNQDSLSGLFQNLHQPIPRKLGIALPDGKEYIDIEDIIRIEADGSYSTIRLKSGREIMVSRNIGEYEALLQDHSFLRVHNSHLINMLSVSKYTRHDGGWVTMEDRSEIPVARRRKDLFESLMAKMAK